MFNMKKIKDSLFNFRTAYYYTYGAGILVSIAVNLFTNGNLPLKVYGIALYLGIASFAMFRIGVILEIARSEWEATGSPYGDTVLIREDYIEKGNRKKLIYFYSIVVIVTGLVLPILLHLIDFDCLFDVLLYGERK